MDIIDSLHVIKQPPMKRQQKGASPQKSGFQVWVSLSPCIVELNFTPIP